MKFIVAAVILSFIAGFYSYPLLRHRTNNLIPDGLRLQPEDSRYTFIRPLLACQVYENMEYSQFKPLETVVNQAITNSRVAKEIDSASIYFRDLTSGRWFGIDEERDYSPASLLKVPVMIAYLKQSEDEEGMLQKKFFYQDTDPLNVKPLITNPILKNGNSYSALELMRGMIIDSDNHAKDLLEAAVDPVILKETYHDLGIASPFDNSTVSSPDYQISTKTYALFLRVLYNGTYLSKDDSEMALKLLSEAKFDKGLRAGIPADITIAHKYGIRLVSEDGNDKNVELNDCGIVYNKPNPYLLCIMTSGKDPEKMAYFIASTTEKIQSVVEDGGSLIY